MIVVASSIVIPSLSLLVSVRPLVLLAALIFLRWRLILRAQRDGRPGQK